MQVSQQNHISIILFYYLKYKLYNYKCLKSFFLIYLE